MKKPATLDRKPIESVQSLKCTSGIKWYQVVSSGIIEAEVSSGRQVIFPKPIFSHRVEHQMDSNGGRVRQLSGHSHGMKLKDAVL